MWYTKYKEHIDTLRKTNQHIFNKQLYKETLLKCLIACEREIKWKKDTYSMDQYGSEDFTIIWLEKSIEAMDLIYKKNKETVKNIEELIEKMS
jgi:ribonucleotide reductase beta subunit family protein with ferritin-like domain